MAAGSPFPTAQSTHFLWERAYIFCRNFHAQTAMTPPREIKRAVQGSQGGSLQGPDTELRSGEEKDPVTWGKWNILGRENKICEGL